MSCFLCVSIKLSSHPSILSVIMFSVLFLTSLPLLSSLLPLLKQAQMFIHTPSEIALVVEMPKPSVVLPVRKGVRMSDACERLRMSERVFGCCRRNGVRVQTNVGTNGRAREEKSTSKEEVRVRTREEPESERRENSDE